MNHTIVWCALVAGCGGGEKKVETTPVSNSAGSAAREPEPPRQNRSAALIAAYNAYVDTVCACGALPSDRAMPCVQAATDKYARENMPQPGEKLDPADVAGFAKATAPATKKFSDCLAKIATAAAGNAATP